jgi:hypothetical protein
VSRWFALLLLAAACNQTKYDADGEPITLGRVRLRTFPKGAQVWIDGKLEIVSTPATIVKDAGEYHLKIQAPGAEAVERTITIEAGESKEIRMKIPQAPPATVTVLSDVTGAIVRINGYKRGETPLLRANTKPGPLDVTVLGPFNRAKSVKTDLKLSEQKTIHIFFGEAHSEAEEGPSASMLEVPMSVPAAKGWVTIGLDPEGSVETDDGKKLGDTPLVKHPMTPGLHRIWLRSKDGRYERRVQIEIVENEPAVYRFRLTDADEVPGWAEK